jgi:hypothetical protein
MKKKLKIDVANFWKGFREGEIYHDYLFKLLRQRYEVEFSDNPDVLFFSVFPDDLKDHMNYHCLKIFYNGENASPPDYECDYSFSFEETDERNFHLPNFVRHPYFQEFRQQDFSARAQELRDFPKEKFCNFIYSNPHAQERQAFCRKLMEYKPVDCPGRVLNNMPGLSAGWNEKLNFIKRYKFTIAFENVSAPRYTTEKIYHPLLVKSIPIYWGNPDVAEYFNPASFVNCRDYENFDQVIAHVREIDQDDDLYQQYLNANPVAETGRLHNFAEEAILERLDQILAPVLMRKAQHVGPATRRNLIATSLERFKKMISGRQSR